MSINLGGGGGGGAGGGGGGGGINNSNIYIGVQPNIPVKPKLPYCALLDKSGLKMDYTGFANIVNGSNDFRVTIEGRINSSPQRVLIAILPSSKPADKGINALHINFDFTIGKTILNTRTAAGWGREEFAYFSTLTPGRFSTVITSTGSVFEIKVNNEQPVYFNHRIALKEATRGVLLQGSMVPSLVKIDYFQ